MPPVSLECPPQIPKMPACAPAESRGNARAAASTDLQRIGTLRERFVALYHIGMRRAHRVRRCLTRRSIDIFSMKLSAAPARRQPAPAATFLAPPPKKRAGPPGHQAG